MKSIFLDTETTGLRPGNIIQLTYIIEENKELVGAKNFFFEVDHVEDAAERVHGFSVERLRELSNGIRFDDMLDEILVDFDDATLIAHNIKFDYKFLQAELDRNFLDISDLKQFCTMKYFKNIVALPNPKGDGIKNPKLEEVVSHYGIDRDMLLKATEELFGCQDIGYHDARYDTVALYVCCLMSKKRADVSNLIK